MTMAELLERHTFVGGEDLAEDHQSSVRVRFGVRVFFGAKSTKWSLLGVASEFLAGVFDPTKVASGFLAGD